MRAIVFNTLVPAVTQHELPFTCLSAGYAGSADGMFAIGGATDNGTAIDARFVLPQTDQGTGQRKRIPAVFVDGTAEDCPALLIVKADGQEYSYDFWQRSGGISRAEPARGIYAHRLAVGYENMDGAGFRVRSFDAPLFESKRRVG